jgi:Fic family protein
MTTMTQDDIFAAIESLHPKKRHRKPGEGVTRNEVIAKFGYSYSMATKYLRELVDTGEYEEVQMIVKNGRPESVFIPVEK